MLQVGGLRHRRGGGGGRGLGDGARHGDRGPQRGGGGGQARQQRHVAAGGEGHVCSRGHGRSSNNRLLLRGVRLCGVLVPILLWLLGLGRHCYCPLLLLLPLMRTGRDLLLQLRIVDRETSLMLLNCATGYRSGGCV